MTHPTNPFAARAQNQQRRVAPQPAAQQPNAEEAASPVAAAAAEPNPVAVVEPTAVAAAESRTLQVLTSTGDGRFDQILQGAVGTLDA